MGNQAQSQKSPKYNVDQLAKLKCAADNQIVCSTLYLGMLRRKMEVSQQFDSTTGKAVEDGFYYLCSAYKLVEEYKRCIPGAITETNIRTINDTLVKLEFDPNHYVGQAECFVSKGQHAYYYKLLHNQGNVGIGVFVRMVERHIDAPVQAFLKLLNLLLPSTQSTPLVKAEIIQKYVIHGAVLQGDIDAVKTLLKPNADVTQINSDGMNSLHIAVLKDHTEMVKILLQHTSHDRFINAKTSISNITSLHIAAMQSNFDIVLSLLKHSAIYNVINAAGKIPVDHSSGKVADLLKLLDELFKDAVSGNVDLINKLRAVQPDEFAALTNACNNEGRTLLQVVTINSHKDIETKLLDLIQLPPLSPESELEQLEKLKTFSELNVGLYKLYVSTLHKSTDRENKANYYLCSAHTLAQLNNANESLRKVSDALVEFEFDPNRLDSKEASYCNILRLDVELFVVLALVKIDTPVKALLEVVNRRLQHILSEKLLSAIKSHDYTQVQNCIEKGANVNTKYSGGKTPLHHAVRNVGVNVLNMLLKNNADALQTTDEGETPLYYAVSERSVTIVEILLRYNPQCIDTATTNGVTPLQYAAHNGSLEIVKFLMKHGATYDMQNYDDEKINDFIRLVDQSFKYAKNGNASLITVLRAMTLDAFEAVTNTRNNQGATLRQVASAGIANKLLEVTEQTQLRLSPNQLVSLKTAADLHMCCSGKHLRLLRIMSEPCGSPDNPFPWKTLKEGSYYLRNAHKLVKMSDAPDNRSVRTINNALTILEFDPRHISSGYTDEAYGGQGECFVSKGQGAKYYKMLHDDAKKGVRSFIEFVEYNIDVPVKMLLEVINRRMKGANL